MKQLVKDIAKRSGLGLIGASLFTFGVLFLLLWNWLFDLLLSHLLILKPSSVVFEPWRGPPPNLAMDAYFFNWTNPEDIYDHSQRPKFTEIGPYHFTEHREKVNITWNQNGTVSYRLWRKWHFVESKSVGKLTDKITTLNAVAMLASNHVKNWNYFIKKGLSHTLTATGYEVHIVKDVGELMYGGYEDPVLKIAPLFGIDLPAIDKFGWFYPRNNSYTFDGVFNINTGTHGNMGEMKSWNYNQSTIYHGECSKVRGSAGELYPRGRKRDSISIFSTDMCRSMRIDYEEDTLSKGIRGYKYSAQAGFLDNGTLIPENECNCGGKCVPSGMLNVSACKFGAPVFISLPHFYGADPVYMSMVDGIKPEKTKHETYITLEPITAIPLDVALRLQVNVKIAPIENINMYEDVPELFIPIFWAEQVISVPNEFIWKLWIVSNTPTICSTIGSIFVIFGILLCAYVTGQSLMGRSHKTKRIIPLSTEKVPLNQHAQAHRLVKRRLSYRDNAYS